MTLFGLFNFVTKRLNLYSLSSCRISPTEIDFLKQTTVENSEGFFSFLVLSSPPPRKTSCNNLLYFLSHVALYKSN